MSFIHFRNIPAVIGLMFILTVTLTGVSHGEEAELPQPPPDEYTERGRIDRMTADEIVINDSLYRLTPSTTFNTPTMENAPRASFQEGNLVLFTRNKDFEVISIRLIE